MGIPLIDLRAQYQSIQAEMDEAILGVVREAAFIGGVHVSGFERGFAEFCGASHCVGMGNGTDALYIALRALGVGFGDQVITVANSFIATSEAISLTGAEVRFVDCDPSTYNIDVRKVEAAITPRTKAIVAVHLYGRPADLPSLSELCRRHRLFLVEDAAQAHGAECDGRRVGSLGDVACFSFYPGKNLGAYGDAGAIVTNHHEVAMRCRMLANHGRLEKYDHQCEGVNSRLDGIQAAVLQVKLRYLVEWTERRRSIATLYRELLKDADVVTPEETVGTLHVHHLYVVRVPRRNAVQATLRSVGIETGVHYPIALPNLKAYAHLGHRAEDFPVATQFSREVLSLPMYPELSNDQVATVCQALRKAL